MRDSAAIRMDICGENRLGPKDNMKSRSFRIVVPFTLLASLIAGGQDSRPQDGPQTNANSMAEKQPGTKVPKGVILVKGAWSSASDSLTPTPEGGSVTNGRFTNPYFGMTYSLPSNWTEKFKGPPPSDSGLYVLTQLSPSDNVEGRSPGSILITAQDMFFSPIPSANAFEFVTRSQSHLQADYKVEVPPKETRIAGRSFTIFEYGSPLAELHWYAMATEIRCHIVEFVLTSRDEKLLRSLIQQMNGMQLPVDGSSGAPGVESPVCVKDYADGEHLLERVDPIFTQQRFNPVPLRIIVDEEGRIKHIHFLSAFPDQEKAISDALKQWRFKPYVQNGKAVEVETGLMFGRNPYPPKSARSASAD